MAKHLETGKRGEVLAAQHLVRKGWQILERNWRFSRAEIDIIAKTDDILVFVEVKTRSSIGYGTPDAFVNQKKQDLMVDAAHRFIDEQQHLGEIRFDIISIVIRKGSHTLHHFEDAFFPDLE